jgi:hypothetical protein
VEENIMQGKTYRACFLWCLMVALVSLALSEPPHVQAERQPSNPAAAIVTAQGQGILPGEEAGLTAAERRTAAHTVALVDALGELATRLASPSSSSPAGTIDIEHEAQLGEALTVTKRSILKGQMMVQAVTVVTSLPRAGQAVPDRIVVENWELTYPPVRELDVYAFLYHLHQAGVAIDAWQMQEPGIVTVAVSIASSHLNPPAPTGLVLVTDDEAEQLRLSEAEWLLPTSGAILEEGPRIIFRQPKLVNTSTPPTLATTSPTDLFVLFEPNGSPVDMNSLQVRARKGIFKKSLTSTLKPFIEGTAIRARGLQVPVGKYLLEVDIADQAGARTFKKYYLQVHRP